MTTTIGSNTRISLSLVIQIGALLFSAGILWAKMDSIQQDVRKQWTIPQQRIWAERLANKNPTLFVPDVEEVIRTINTVN